MTCKNKQVLQDANGVQYDIRMLEVRELAAAMGFITEDDTYEFVGNKSQQIKQVGNAVSVRKLTTCVGALMADAFPKRQAANPRLKKAA